MSGKKIFLLVVFGAMLAYAVWQGMKSRAGMKSADDSAAIMNQKAFEAEAAPYGSGTQPSYPSPDTLAAEDPGAPGAQPLFFGGSVPSTQ